MRSSNLLFIEALMMIQMGKTKVMILHKKCAR
jgi:hypothetical protein